MEGRGRGYHGGQGQARGRGRRGRIGSGRFQHSPERPSSSNVGHCQPAGEHGGNSSRHQNWRQSSRGGNQQRHNPASTTQRNWRQQDQDDNEQARHKYNPFTYHNLKKLALEESDNDVVKIVANSDYDFEGFIQGQLRLDLFHFVIQVLTKVCKSDYDESKSKILGIMCESASFLNSFMPYIMESVNEKRPQELVDLICNILTISETVAQYMPLTACDKLLNIIQGCEFCCKGLYDAKQIPLDEATLHRFEDFRLSLTEKKSKVLDTNKQLKIESRNERLQKLAPPNDFRTISAAPTSEDVLCRNDAIFLRPNLVHGKYDSIDHYLDVQFRLLREDFVRPLREGIAAYISGDKKLMQNSSVRLHKDVKFIRRDDKTVDANNPRNKDVKGILVQFDDPKKKKKRTIDWEHTRRFMYGSLLCFSKDNFRSLLISTVSDRDLTNLGKGLLRVVFSQEVEENIYHQKYTMVESEVFFDPYLHVLKTLQSLEESTFPLPEYLIHVQQDDFPPAYLEPKHEHDAPVIYNIPGGNQEWPLIVANHESWPTPEELELDNSQWLALHAALTRELVVIQGPPGTGKTYMGLRIAEILIRNKLQTGRQSPILVVCLTNHALDQFLVDILKFTRKIIRIGGQSKCTELMEYNLRNLKRQTKSRDQVKLIVNLKDDITALKFQVSEFDSSIAAIKSNAGIVAFEMFCRAGIVPNVNTNFFSRNYFNKWLLEDRIENERTQLDVISNVQYCFLVEEFDKNIASLENQKYAADGAINVQELCQIQQQLQEDKEWLERCLDGEEEMATKEQCEKWITYIWKLKSYQKWQLYHYWLRQLENCMLEEIRIRENEILKKNNELSELQIVDDLEILREADVVGMTTTGAARLHKLLRKLGPEIVIVEEAAEVMESHVVACLTEKCCHLILIGDHKQLRPQIATYDLEKKFNFDVSLFERMVINREKCITLQVQHRMAPEIAQLITPSIYPALINAEKVKFYPAITGVPKRLFFIDHKNQEEMLDLDSNSRINRFEASFILALCRHLILQGYQSSQITILTTYRGQMFHIKKLMKGVVNLEGVVAQVVDNYQGEENDIILLSLVRSNPERRIGFLATENRVCVALSRAKHALYIVGDMSCLTKADKVPAEKNIWIKIKDTLQKQNAIGNALTLKCDVHPEQVFTVSTGPDFSKKAPEGGCLLVCTSKLLCTHPCNRVCHVLERDHVNMKCLSPCIRLCDANLHTCKKKCYETCGDCMVNVEKTLRCGHRITLKCHVNPKTIVCNEIVVKTFKPCNHEAEVLCHIDPHSNCPRNCDHRLRCGHSCVQKCHFTSDPDHILYVCQKPCGRRNTNCSMDHECGRRCCDECAKCTVKIEKKRKCGHMHFVKCSEDVDEVIECDEKCTLVLKCGHKCKRKCKENCNPCLQTVKKESACGHEVVVKCDINPGRMHCNNKCPLALPCGHPCTSTCNKPCTAKCLVEMYTVKGTCGHQVPLLCWEHQQGMTVPSSTSRCSQACSALLNCEHMCSGTCGTCYQGRFHSLCDMPCGRVLVCGHPCKQPCAVMCPPCEEKCTLFCNHSKCRRKCGEPCAPCKERCQWQCEHKNCKRRCGEICDRDPCDEPCPKRLKCGHNCIGFCGEPCPKLCRSCNVDEVTDIFFGTEDEPDARFINLVDCGHCIEVTGMQNWMTQNDDMVSKKSCPRCTKTISRSLRFGNDIKQAFFDISKVKKKIFGNVEAIKVKRKELETKVERMLRECTRDSQEYHELRWFLEETVKSLHYTVDNRINVLSSTSIRCKEIEVDIISRVCEVWQKSNKLGRERREELQKHANLIIENLEAKKHRLSQQQVIDFELEVLRLQNILHYLVFKHEALTRPNLQYILKKFQAIVLDFTKRYSIEKHRAAEVLFNEMKELVKTLPGLGITDFERKNIVQALQLSQGHWFKCPNGHPYIITECGGAMQESKCNECGAAIGGGQHRLRNDNSHFSMMDGATHAAWSEQANLLNYRF